MQLWKLYKVPILLTLVSLFLYLGFAYDLIRTEYSKLILIYTLLWLGFILLMKYTKENIKLLGFIALGFRAIFILSIPNLSQDFYRFIWDGRLIIEGLNPYLYTPESLINSGVELPIYQARELYEGMGALNGSHYSNYPPLNQLCFVIAGLFSGHSILGSVIILRLLIIAADVGTFFFGKRLLQKLNIPVKNIFWYILNPFIIIELTGNLHFEGVMIFFLIWSIYLLHSGQWKWAAVVFALSISVKLIPLLFLPLLFWYFKKSDKFANEVENSSDLEHPKFQKSIDHAQVDSETFLGSSQYSGMDFKKLISFYSIVGLTTIILFAPFYSPEFISNYAETVALWFQNFEFNASIYYLAREIGYSFRGYNEVAIIGKILAALVFLFVIILSIYRKNINTKTLIFHMLLAFSFYLFMSTTVHPWYIATLLILSVFTNYKYPLVWSFVIILSYLAYLNVNQADKSENLWIIAIEYSIVYAIFIWEILKSDRQLELVDHEKIKNKKANSK